MARYTLLFGKLNRVVLSWTAAWDVKHWYAMRAVVTNSWTSFETTTAKSGRYYIQKLFETVTTLPAHLFKCKSAANAITIMMVTHPSFHSCSTQSKIMFMSMRGIRIPSMRFFRLQTAQVRTVHIAARIWEPLSLILWKHHSLNMPTRPNIAKTKDPFAYLIRSMITLASAQEWKRRPLYVLNPRHKPKSWSGWIVPCTYPRD